VTFRVETPCRPRFAWCPHFGDRQLQSPLTALSLLQRTGIKRQIAGLRHAQFQRPQPGFDRLGLEPVGPAATQRRPLERLSAEHGRAFQFHRFIDQHLHGLGHSLETVVAQQFQQRVPTAGCLVGPRLLLDKGGRCVSLLVVGHTSLLEDVEDPKVQRL
jgi:hypothetical protein